MTHFQGSFAACINRLQNLLGDLLFQEKSTLYIYLTPFLASFLALLLDSSDTLINQHSVTEASSPHVAPATSIMSNASTLPPTMDTSRTAEHQNSELNGIGGGFDQLPRSTIENVNAQALAEDK